MYWNVDKVADNMKSAHLVWEWTDSTPKINAIHWIDLKNNKEWNCQNAGGRIQGRQVRWGGKTSPLLKDNKHVGGGVVGGVTRRGVEQMRTESNRKRQGYFGRASSFILRVGNRFISGICQLAAIHRMAKYQRWCILSCGSFKQCSSHLA